MAFPGRAQKRPLNPYALAAAGLVTGYLLCYFIQVPTKPKVPPARRLTAEDDGVVIPHAPSRTPLGRCCCSTGGVCFGDADFDIMFHVNSTPHLERFKHISGPREDAGWSPYPTFTELHQIIYRTEVNLYENFQMVSGVTWGGDGSHVNDATMELFHSLQTRPPKFMVEVGSGLGNSAIWWGREVKANGGTLICFDTWEGDLSMWFSEAWREVMGWQDGVAHLYERFLSRIVRADLTDTVLPVRVQSSTGARMLNVLNYTVDAIYLDAAQEGGEFYMDLMMYWDILTPGGILMGDDYMWYWPGVIHDVDLFMKHQGLGANRLHFSKDWDYWTGSGTWALQKPLEDPGYTESVSMFRRSSDGPRS